MAPTHQLFAVNCVRSEPGTPVFSCLHLARHIIMHLLLVLALVPLLALGHYGSNHHHAVDHTHHGCYPRLDEKYHPRGPHITSLSVRGQDQADENLRQKSQTKISDKNLRRKSQTKISDEKLRRKCQMKILDENFKQFECVICDTDNFVIKQCMLGVKIFVQN